MSSVNSDIFLHYIFPRLSIHDLLDIALVNKAWYGLSRNNYCWAPHYTRVTTACPPLKKVFDAYMTQQPKRKRHCKHVSIGTKRGIWYVFVKILLSLPVNASPSHVLRFKRCKGDLLSAILFLNFPFPLKSLTDISCDIYPDTRLRFKWTARLYLFNHQAKDTVACNISQLTSQKGTDMCFHHVYFDFLGFHIEPQRWIAPLRELILNRGDSNWVSHMGMFNQCPLYTQYGFCFY